MPPQTPKPQEYIGFPSSIVVPSMQEAVHDLMKNKADYRAYYLNPAAGFQHMGYSSVEDFAIKRNTLIKRLQFLAEVYQEKLDREVQEKARKEESLS